MPDPGRPDVLRRESTWLLGVLACAHAAAALASVLHGGSPATGWIDVALAVLVTAGALGAVLVTRLAALSARRPGSAGRPGSPGRAGSAGRAGAAGRAEPRDRAEPSGRSGVTGSMIEQGIVVAAIWASAAVSGLRAERLGTPWAGADVVLSVGVAVVLPTVPVFWAAVGGALVAWAGVQSLASSAAPEVQWALVGIATAGVVAATAVIHAAVTRMAREAVEARQAAEQRTVTDALTGVTNRRGLELMALPMIEHARRQGEAAHCLFIDLDGFRSVNEALGRGSGDDVLTAVCEAVLASVRATDVVARWAGDQFVVVGPGTGTSPLEMERRVSAHLHEDPPVPPDVWDGRVSIGSATLVPWDEGGVDALLHRSEEDMRLRRSLRRQSRSRSVVGGLSAGPGTPPPIRTERRSRPPKTPPAPGSVAEER